jgi:hypothetical protein
MYQIRISSWIGRKEISEMNCQSSDDFGSWYQSILIVMYPTLLSAFCGYSPLYPVDPPQSAGAVLIPLDKDSTPARVDIGRPRLLGDSRGRQERLHALRAIYSKLFGEVIWPLLLVRSPL